MMTSMDLAELIASLHPEEACEQQTFTGNGITVEFPAGYRSIHDFQFYLEYSLRPESRLDPVHREQYASELDRVNAALA